LKMDNTVCPVHAIGISHSLHLSYSKPRRFHDRGHGMTLRVGYIRALRGSA